jgi:hypothetical protein
MYSDPVLAFKLLDKANMEEADMKQLFSCIGEKFFPLSYEAEVPVPYRYPQLKDVEYVYIFQLKPALGSFLTCINSPERTFLWRKKLNSH